MAHFGLLIPGTINCHRYTGLRLTGQKVGAKLQRVIKSSFDRYPYLALIGGSLLAGEDLEVKVPSVSLPLNRKVYHLKKSSFVIITFPPATLTGAKSQVEGFQSLEWLY